MMWRKRQVVIRRIITAALSLQLVFSIGSVAPMDQALAAGIEGGDAPAEAPGTPAEDTTDEVSLAGVGKMLPDNVNIIMLVADAGETVPASMDAVQSEEAPSVEEPLYFASSIDLPKLEAEAVGPRVTAADLRAEQALEASMTPEEKAAAAAEEEAAAELIGKIGVTDVSQSLNVRADHEEDAELVGRLYRGTGAYIEDIEGDWTHISSGKVEGWVLSKYLLTEENAEALVEESQPQVATVVVEELCVRSKADDESDILTTITTDMQFPVLEVEDNWLKIQLTSQAEGYVHAEYVSVDKGLFVGVTAEEEASIQADLDQREADRQAMAEAARQAAIAAQEEEKRSNSSSSSSHSSSGSSSSSSSSSGSSSSHSSSSGSSGSSSSSSSSSSHDSESSSGGDGWVSLGTFKITAYCPCSKCNGSNAGATASGASMDPGWTIAADTSVISMGTVVKIEGVGEREVQDTGVYGNTIDLLVSSHSECYSWGVRYREVWVQK